MSAETPWFHDQTADQPPAWQSPILNGILAGLLAWALLMCALGMIVRGVSMWWKR